VRLVLEGYVRACLDSAGILAENKNRPLFRPTLGTTKRSTERPLTTKDVCRMVKRRLKDAGLPTRLSPHSFRVTAITDLLTQGVPLEGVQYLAGHAEPRTTGLYDRRQRKVTRNIVERISI
jgi:site-specific recombinase XerD